MDGLFSELFGFDPCEVEPTTEDIAELNAMDEDEDVVDEWNSYYMSSRL